MINFRIGLFNYSLLFLIGLIWSASFLFIKISVITIPPYTLTAGRLGVAVLALTLYSFLRGYPLPTDARSWGIFAFIGLFGNALPFTLIGWGETHIDSGLAAVLMGIMPVSTVLLAHLFIPEEPFTVRKGLGITLSFGGLLTLVGLGALSGYSALAVAQLAVLTGAMSYAVVTIFVRRYAQLPGPTMSLGAVLMGFIWVLPLSLVIDQPWTINPHFSGIASLIILGLFSTALASIIYFFLLPRIGATNFSQVNYLTPVLGAIWGIIFLGEKITTQLVMALILVLVGIAVVTRSR